MELGSTFFIYILSPGFAVKLWLVIDIQTTANILKLNAWKISLNCDHFIICCCFWNCIERFVSYDSTVSLIHEFSLKPLANFDSPTVPSIFECCVCMHTSINSSPRLILAESYKIYCFSDAQATSNAAWRSVNQRWSFVWITYSVEKLFSIVKIFRNDSDPSRFWASKETLSPGHWFCVSPSRLCESLHQALRFQTTHEDTYWREALRVPHVFLSR